MRRVEIVAPRRRVLELLRAVHRAGVVELVPFERSVGPAEAAPTPIFGPCPDCPDRADREAALGMASELAGLLGRQAAPHDLVSRLWELDDAALAERVASLRPVHERAAALTEQRRRLAAEERRIGECRELIGALAPVAGLIPRLRGYGAIAALVPARAQALLDLLRPELELVAGGRSELITADLDAQRIALLALFPREALGPVQELFGRRGIAEADLPEACAGLPLAEALARLDGEQSADAAAFETAGAELLALAEGHGAESAALAAVLADRFAESDAVAGAAASDHLVAFGGWVPDDRLAELRAGLAADFGPEALLDVRPGERRVEEAEAPVALRNPRLLRPFEPLASFLGLPRYGSLDPTPFLAVTFPAFVGLMVGDAGYGLVMLGLLLAVRLRWPRSAAVRLVVPIGIPAAAATVFFGVLFGEWFGDAGHLVFGLHPLALDRREAILPMLVLALSIGIAHVGLGLGLGVANAIRLGERREAAVRVLLLTCLFAMVALVAGRAGGWIPDPAGWLLAVSLAAAAVGLVVLAGLAGSIELVGIFGNVLSYARLMAIGLASVMLATVANQLGGLSGSILAGLLVGGLLHVLNFSLGFFDSTVQGLRLHYVEFFGRFVDTGGRRFRPFAAAIARADGQARPVGR